VLPQLDPLAGEEHASNLLFDLGCKAWRSPASGGGAPDGLDCVFFLSFRVFSAKKMPYLQMLGFLGQPM
jgi:hypothetical protein